MFDHVTLSVGDRDASERFYDTVLAAIGVEKTASTDAYAEWGEFSLAQGDAPTRGLHVGFCAWSRDDVDAFWRRGVDAGYESDGEPGMRTQYTDDYYGGFLLDPDGNSAEAVHMGDMVRQGNIDHLWIRVADLDSCRAFYESISPYSGFPLRSQPPGRVHFSGAGSSFALVTDDRPLTQNLHVAFPADSDATVDAFHSSAMAAGYADNGKPGERPSHHPGYYAAYVLDPAGANVEVVNHNR
jgi:catechol 2,3-dioxygenase-like lactoylglutathione lyase family enzyme